MATRSFRLVALCVVPLVSSVTGCIVAGPASIAAGRGVYNEVINRTEDEQLLNMIVRERYSATYGRLGVASVTASIRASAKVGAQFGLSRTVKEDYDGNLVPLAAGVAYEENPTISYIPLGGEEFVQRLVSPLSMEESLLMQRYARHWGRGYMKIGIRSINGIRNPRPPAVGKESVMFDRVVHLWQQLSLAGVLVVARDPNGDFKAVFVVDDAEHGKVLEELLELAKISKRPSGGRLVLPVGVAVEGWSEDAFIFEPSPYWTSFVPPVLASRFRHRISRPASSSPAKARPAVASCVFALRGFTRMAKAPSPSGTEAGGTTWTTRIRKANEHF